MVCVRPMVVVKGSDSVSDFVWFLSVVLVFL